MGAALVRESPDLIEHAGTGSPDELTIRGVVSTARSLPGVEESDIVSALSTFIPPHLRLRQNLERMGAEITLTTFQEMMIREIEDVLTQYFSMPATSRKIYESDRN